MRDDLAGKTYDGVTATSFAFGSLTDSKEMMASCEKDSKLFINNGDTDLQTLHDFDKFLQKKMLLEMSTFFY